MTVRSGAQREAPAGENILTHPLTATFIAAVVSVAAWAALSSIWIDVREADIRENVTLRVEHDHAALLTAVRSRTGMLVGLETYVQGALDDNRAFGEFESVAQGFISSTIGIRNLSIAPDGVHEHVYPLEGNEASLGHDLMADERPQVQADLTAMLETGEQHLSGPYELRQGGLGLVSRRPIYRDGEFWGLVAMVLDIPPVLTEAGVKEDMSTIDLVVVVQGDEPFFGDPAVFDREPVSVSGEVHGDTWILAGAPPGGWREGARDETRAERLVGVLLPIVLTLATLSITTRSRRLRAMNVELRTASTAKDDFLASMSHELRTPLNSVIGYSGILLSETPGPINEEQRRQLGMVETSGKRLLALVNDVLDLSRIEAAASRLEITEVDLPEMCEAILEEVRPQAGRKSLELHLDCEIVECCPDGVLRTDPDKLAQILLNLLSNAIKFTEAGKVSLVARCSDPGTLAVSVSDTGVGIDEASLERVFEQFEQARSIESGKPQGTGLGLAISQRLARLLGGEITVESTVGKGSTFALELPVEPPAAAGATGGRSR